MNEHELRQHALRLGGFLSVDRARTLGCSERQLRTLLRDYGWYHPEPGLLAPPGAPSALPLLRLRAAQAAKPHLVASHRTAARLHGITVLQRPGEAARSIEVTDPRPGRARTRVAGVLVHRLPLGPHDSTAVEGLRCTTILRTLTDLLRSEPRNTAVAALDSALHAGLCTEEDVRAHLAGASNRQATSTALRWVELADARSESPLETEARLLMYDADLHPRTQAEVATAAGVRRVDFLFDREGLAVEVDGAEHHWTQDGQRRDLRRFNDLATSSAVRAVLRFSWQDIFLRPHAFLDEIVNQLELLG